MKKTIGYGICAAAVVIMTAATASAHEYGSYNDKVRECKQDRRTGGVIGGFLGAGAGGAAGRALAASKVRPEGVILGTVVGAVIGSKVGKEAVECGDLEYRKSDNNQYSQDYTRDYGRSYGQGVVKHHGPVGHAYHEHYQQDGYYQNAPAHYTPAPYANNGQYYNAPQATYNNSTYFDGWYVPSQYSYYGQQAGYVNQPVYTQPVVTEAYSYSYGPEYIPAPAYTPPPVYNQPQYQQQYYQPQYQQPIYAPAAPTVYAVPSCGTIVCQ